MHIHIPDITTVPNILVLHYIIEESELLTAKSLKVYYLFFVSCYHQDFIVLLLNVVQISSYYIVSLWKTFVEFTLYYYGKSLLILHRVVMDNAH